MPHTDDEKVVKIRTNAPRPTSTARNGGPWEVISETREAAGLSRAELAGRARVSELTVEAIESGALERLPIGVAGDREVQAVCRALRLEPAPFLEAASTRSVSPLSSALVSQKPSQRRFSWLKVAIVVWVIVLAGAVVARIVASESTDQASTDTKKTESVDTGEKTAAQNEDPGAETATTAPPAPETTAAPATEPPGPAYAVRIVAATEDTWLQAVVNGEEQFVGTIPEGETREFSGDSVQLTIGRPHAVELIVNEEPYEPSRTVQLG